QIVTPLFADERLAAILSLHQLGEPRAWRGQDGPAWAKLRARGGGCFGAQTPGPRRPPRRPRLPRRGADARPRRPARPAGAPGGPAVPLAAARSRARPPAPRGGRGCRG